MYERLLTWILNPAFAIFSMVASCKLPFGNPNLNFVLSVIKKSSQLTHQLRTIPRSAALARLLFRLQSHVRSQDKGFARLPECAREASALCHYPARAPFVGR